MSFRGYRERIAMKPLFFSKAQLFFRISVFLSVFLAGCGFDGKVRNTYERFLRHAAHHLSGRILSIYDTADNICGSCEEAFHLAGKDVSSK